MLAVCLPGAAAGQGPDGRRGDAAVKEAHAEGVSEARRRVERALGRIQGRVVGDRTCKRLADGPIHRRDHGPLGFELSIGAAIDDPIEVPMPGDAAPVKIPGHVTLRVRYDPAGVHEEAYDGPYHGCVSWATSDPHVFVVLYWRTTDPDAPDRLARLVREEMGREGLRLAPPSRPKWPIATNSERLSQLLPPDALPMVAFGPAATAGPRQGPVGVFPSPRDVAAAYNEAIAKKDLRGYLRCLTPHSQTYLMGCLIQYVQHPGSPELAKAIEKHFGYRVFDEGGVFLPEERLWRSEGDLKAGRFLPLDDPADLWLARLSPGAYLDELFRKAVGDVPTFLAECLPMMQAWDWSDVEPLACEGLWVEGDRASSRSLHKPTPDLEKIEAGWNERHFLPEYHPIHFQRIQGSWRIASMIDWGVE